MTASPRQALIIGNDNYACAPLRTCVNDAKGINEALHSINFHTKCKINLSKRQMEKVAQKYVESIVPGAIVFFYYAGHGGQHNGINYLLPIDDDRAINISSIDDTLFNVQKLIDSMEKRKPKLMVIILDACRVRIRSNNAKDGHAIMKPGLGPMRVPPSTIVAYACAANQISNGQSKYSDNGVYTYHLMKLINTPNIDIDLVLRRVAIKVQEETKNAQIPFRYSSCNELIFLVKDRKHRRHRHGRHKLAESGLQNNNNPIGQGHAYHPLPRYVNVPK